MKKIILLVLLFLLNKELFGQKMMFVPEVGIGGATMNMFTEKQNLAFNVGTNSHVGVGYYVQFSKRVLLHTGIFYNDENAGIDLGSIGQDSSYRFEMRFRKLAIPLGFVFQQSLRNNKLLYLGVCTQYNFILTGETADKYYYNNVLVSNEVVKFKRNKEVVNTESSLLLKAGIRFSKHWGVYSNFNIGITNINKNISFLGPNVALRMVSTNFGVNYFIYRK